LFLNIFPDGWHLVGSDNLQNKPTSKVFGVWWKEPFLHCVLPAAYANQMYNRYKTDYQFRFEVSSTNV
jgi:hypothetical protein